MVWINLSFLTGALKAAQRSDRGVRAQAAQTSRLGRGMGLSPRPTADPVVRAIWTAHSEGRFTPSHRLCPACTRPMAVVRHGAVEVDCCGSCRGIWLDTGELKFLTKSASDLPGRRFASRPSRFNCPCCGKPMREYVYKNPHNLLLDACVDDCGIFLEAGELDRARDLAGSNKGR